MRHDFALTGDPIAHSLSPVMHRAAFRASDLDGTYTLRPGGSEAFDAAVDEMHSGGLTGINVTMPHKQRAFEVCDALSDLAQLAGSVNTLKYVDGETLGHSTDAQAFFSLLGSGPLKIDRVAVLGSGGSAASALAAIGALTGDYEVFVQARRRTAAQALVSRVGIDATVVEWGTPPRDALVINATPVGMAGERLPEQMIEVAAGLIDLPYAGGETSAVREAMARGIPTVDGLRFLALQGAASFLWWTGTAVDPDVMEAVARNG